MNGLICIYKNDQIIYSNKEPHPLLLNLIQGLETIGNRVFSSHLKIIKAPPLNFGVFFKDELIIVIVEENEEKIMKKYEEETNNLLKSINLQ